MPNNGKVPNDMDLLEELPGVGHKTASVVMAQAFNVPSFPVDTHIHRLAQNWKLTTGKSIAQTEKDLKRLFPENKWNKLHLQIILKKNGLFIKQKIILMNLREQELKIC